MSVVTDNEIWMPIIGFENYYQISNLGNLKSLARKCGSGYIGVNYKYNMDRIIKPNITNKYYSAILYAKGKNKPTLIHRLVLQTFNPTKRKNMQVNHKDGNRLNNHINNLEWVTPKENINHAFRTGLCDHRKGENLWNTTLTNQQVYEIKKLYHNNIHTQAELARRFDVGTCCIWHIVHEKKLEAYKTKRG